MASWLLTKVNREARISGSPTSVEGSVFVDSEAEPRFDVRLRSIVRTEIGLREFLRYPQNAPRLARQHARL